jgi:hypothetical protein
MKIEDQLDIPSNTDYDYWIGSDLGLTDSPTVISVFAEGMWGKKKRLALVRKYTLERFRTRQIRETFYTLAWEMGVQLKGVGIDMTGLGFPIFQEMEDDELCPPRLKQIAAGYMFNAKVEVAVDKDLVTENQGVLRDHLGNMVKVIEDEYGNPTGFVTMMPFIAASTRYIREDIDSGFYLLPFDTDVTSDMLQESKQRVERIGVRGESSGGGPQKKGDRFHILDSFRAMAYRRRQDDILAALKTDEAEPVFEITGDEPGMEYSEEVLRAVLGLGS